MLSVYPDHAAPVVVNGDRGAREMRDTRWGMPDGGELLMLLGNYGFAKKSRLDK